MLKKIALVFCLFNGYLISEEFLEKKSKVLIAQGFSLRTEDSFLDRYKFFFTSCHLVKVIPFSDAKDSLCSNNRILDYLISSFTKVHFCRESYWGYQDDLDAMRWVLKEENVEPNSLILLGSCRGATACMNYISFYNDLSIGALILDSAHSNIFEVVRSHIAPFGLSSSCNQIFWKSFFPNYPKAALPIVDQIQYIKNKKLPILLLHSKRDEFIPFIESLYLYEGFKKAGFKHVYIAELKESHMENIEKDSLSLGIVHSFYKEHGFSYNPDYATKNMNEFCYSEENIEIEIKEYLKKIENQLLMAQNKLKILFKVA